MDWFQLLQSEYSITVHNQEVVLRGDGSIFLPKFGTLLVADLHLGKDASFRSQGVPVPAQINQRILEKLGQSLQKTQAKRLIILGDLIHDRNSIYQELTQLLIEWRTTFSTVEVYLVRGNHDRYLTDFPDSWRLVVKSRIVFDSFDLRHEVSESKLAENDKLHIGGHLHPVTLFGRGVDQMRLPCFVAGRRHVVLPAFGDFKGGMVQNHARGLKLYPICDNMVITNTTSK